MRCGIANPVRISDSASMFHDPSINELSVVCLGWSSMVAGKSLGDWTGIGGTGWVHPYQKSKKDGTIQLSTFLPFLASALPFPPLLGLDFDFDFLSLTLDIPFNSPVVATLDQALYIARQQTFYNAIFWFGLSITNIPHTSHTQSALQTRIALDGACSNLHNTAYKATSKAHRSA